MVRILKDLDRDIAGREVVIVEDIIDSGLTLSWLLKNLAPAAPGLARGVRAAAQAGGGQGRGAVRYVGFDIPNEFVVGYGLDYAERYRDLPYIGTLDPKVYALSDPARHRQYQPGTCLSHRGAVGSRLMEHPSATLPGGRSLHRSRSGAVGW